MIIISLIFLLSLQIFIITNITVQLKRQKQILKLNEDIMQFREVQNENSTNNNGPKTLKLENQQHQNDKNFRYLFYGEIGIGRGIGENKDKIQKLKLLFDTGSCDIWVMGKDCKSKQCKSNKQYEKTLSMKQYDEGELDIQYMDGIVEGKLVKDDIYVNEEVLVQDQVIGVARENNLDFMNYVQIDGVLGLARPNPNLKQNQLLSSLITSLSLQSPSKSVFSIFMGKNGGAITFGGHDDQYINNPAAKFMFVPLADPNYWVIEIVGVKKVYVNDYKETWVDLNMCNIGCKAILDTGSYFMYGPKQYIQKINSDVNINNCFDFTNIPNIVFVLVAFNQQGRKHVLELRFDPRDYIVDYGTSCVSGFQEDDYNHGWTFGSLFFQSYYTKFDLINQQIGFIRAKTQEEF